MEKNSKKDFETLEEAAARLLRRLNARRKRPVAESATRIHDHGHEAPVVIEVAEGAAEVCAPFGGFWGLGDNDNRKGWQRDFGRDRANVAETIATRCTDPDDGMAYRSHGGVALLRLHAPRLGEW